MIFEQPIQYASMSDIGFRRQNNQDACLVQVCTDPEQWQTHGHLFMVADGMGGHAVGELAAKMAVDTVPHTFFKSRGVDVGVALQSAITAANATIHKRGSMNRDFNRMGTTCTVLSLTSKGAMIGHVGDSRVYRIRGERIEQLTFDHSLQWELIRQGRMSPEDVFQYQPRNVITRSLGPEPDVAVDLEGPHRIEPGDLYLLCSDGLTGHVSDAEIGTVARELPPGEACRLLTHLANLRGGSDNITVVIVRVGKPPSGISEPTQKRSDAPAARPVGWRLILYWSIAAMLMIGLSLIFVFERYEWGGVLTGLACAATVGLLVRWWRNSPQRDEAASDADEPVGRPYCSALARLDATFVHQLATHESELKRTVDEESWNIDRDAHEIASQEAMEALSEKQYRRSFRAYARAIDLLMTGVHRNRQQKQRSGNSLTSDPQPKPM